VKIIPVAGKHIVLEVGTFNVKERYIVTTTKIILHKSYIS
jgi:hypothetical protein